MSRWKASLIHLTISGIIATVVLALILLLWYPHPLFAAVGGQQVLLILLAMNVTLGPLVTLIVFNAKKSRNALVLDLSVIATLQVVAFIYGMTAVFHARPVFVVFSRDSFDLVTANMLADEDIVSAKHPDYRSLPLTGPIYVYSEMPVDIKERNEVALSAFSGKDLPQFPQYYMPFSEHQAAVVGAAKLIAKLKKQNPEHGTEIDDVIRGIGLSEADLAYVPLRAKHEYLTVLVSKRDGRVLAMLRVNPW